MSDSSAAPGGPPLALAELGWGPPFEAAYLGQHVDGAVPGRVTRVDRGALTVFTEAGEIRALVAAHIAHEPDPLKAPTVGDWVVIADGSVVEVLLRRSAIVRGGAGGADVPQVLAANVDKVFVVCSLEGRFRARRLERLLVLAWQSGASPVAVLTKCDVAEDVAGAVEAAERLIGGGDVVAVSSITGEGMDAVSAFLEPGATVVLLGPSGAGKSTLANRLGRGSIELATGDIRGDGKGRHTTTARELVRLPGGALLIDTPGLRALALWDADEGIAEAFGEIEELAERCRFSDCGHQTEPGCAVAEAIAVGLLDADRFTSYEKLRREQRHLAARVDPRVRAEERKRQKAFGKLTRDLGKR
ncbi:MAG TPA: ribosome small subunit-dependent GTPase A [Acidimicrobiales bacterium]|nr:ribosome small subunit-dependent GTPase A [Acidimicrobiales bacterium]